MVLYHAYRLAIAPTQSISYVQNATSSVMPIVDQIERRTYGNAKHFTLCHSYHHKQCGTTNQHSILIDEINRFNCDNSSTHIDQRYLNDTLC